MAKLSARGRTAKGRTHSYGWKNLGKAKPEMDADQFAAIYARRGYGRV